MYERTESGYRCATHGTEFGPVETCPHAPDCGDVVAVKPATTDKELTLLESESRSAAIYWDRVARELAEGTGQEVNSGIKAGDLALKWKRFYSELISARKQREHELWLVEQDRIRRGDGAK